MKRTLCALLLVLSATPALAQENPAPASPLLGRVGNAYLATMVADDLFTYGSMKNGAVEADPFVRPVVQCRCAAGYAAGLALDLGVQYVVRRVVGRHHPKLAAVILAMAASAHTYGAVASAATMQRGR